MERLEAFVHGFMWSTKDPPLHMHTEGDALLQHGGCPVLHLHMDVTRDMRPEVLTVMATRDVTISSWPFRGLTFFQCSDHFCWCVQHPCLPSLFHSVHVWLWQLLCPLSTSPPGRIKSHPTRQRSLSSQPQISRVVTSHVTDQSGGRSEPHLHFKWQCSHKQVNNSLSLCTYARTSC